MSEKGNTLKSDSYSYCFSLNDIGDLFLVANRDRSNEKFNMTLWVLKSNESNITSLSSFSSNSKIEYPVNVKAYRNEVLVITKDVGTKVYRSFDGEISFAME